MVILLLLMGASWVAGLNVSETPKERNLYAFLLVATGLGVAWFWWSSVRTELRRDGLTVTRGIWPLRHVVSAGYEDVGRVRLVNLNDNHVFSVVVAVRVGQWRNLQIAVGNAGWPPGMSYMRVRGEQNSAGPPKPTAEAHRQVRRGSGGLPQIRDAQEDGVSPGRVAASQLTAGLVFFGRERSELS